MSLPHCRMVILTLFGLLWHTARVMAAEDQSYKHWDIYVQPEQANASPYMVAPMRNLLENQDRSKQPCKPYYLSSTFLLVCASQKRATSMVLFEFTYPKVDTAAVLVRIDYGHNKSYVNRDLIPLIENLTFVGD